MISKFKKNKSLKYCVLFLVIAVIILTGTIYEVKYISYTQENTAVPICKVNTDDKKVSLSFNVSWGGENIEYILEVLDRYNVKATFFLVGSWAEENEVLVQKIYNKGHDIGNYSNTRANTKYLSKEDIEKEINTADEKIYKIIGNKTNLYRPPFGEVDEKTMAVCETLGYQVINWDVDSEDWKDIGPYHVKERVMTNVASGSIVLFHSNINDIKYYLEDIIVTLKEEGYEIVPISQLVYSENYTIDVNGTQSINQ